MLFWYMFYSLPILYFILSAFIPKYIKYWLYSYIAIIWFFSAFRYMVGDDYLSYVSMYNYTNLDSDLFGFKEPVFNIMVAVYKYIGFSSQSLFITYTTITVFFLYFGARKYFINHIDILNFFLIYVCFFSSGYYWGLNAIRQMAAIAVIFWGSSYLLNNQIIKYLIVCFIAICLHYSAIICVLFCFVNKIHINIYKIVLIIVISWIVEYLGGFEYYIKNILLYNEFFNDKYFFLLYQTDNSLTSSIKFLTTIIFMIIYILLYIYNHKYEKNIIINMGLIYIILRILGSSETSLSLITSLMSRFAGYCSLFYITFIVYTLNIEKNKNLKLYYTINICLLLVLSIIMIYIIDGSMNRNYDMNFTIFS